MVDYTPDAWVILKFVYDDDSDTIYKVFGGWYGGFAGSNSWKLNSGITKITEQEDFYDIEGYSGSIYRCYKGVERMSSLMMGMHSSWQKDVPDNVKIEVVDIEKVLPNFTN